MKLQYLGDAKDSFKWDYHDYLVNALGFSVLNIIPMLTPDDGGNDGNLHANLYPARDVTLGFCEQLRNKRQLQTICELPKATQSSYDVKIHNQDLLFTNANRRSYLTNIESSHDELVFIDPDNGFVPDKSCNEKHLKYIDINNILNQISNNSVISVFHHHRRKKFVDDYADIRERMGDCYSTAIYWHSLMFVSVSRSKNSIEKTVGINRRYSESYPVNVID